MPFTPFHMGPGAAIKAVSGNRFSLMVFGFTQVIMDAEPLVRIIRGDKILHGFSHTYVGAILIGMFSLYTGKKFCEWLLRLWNSSVKFKYLIWLSLNHRISWISASSAAFIGTFSHIFLDSIMHSDVHPFSPFSKSNGLYQIMPAGWLYLLCICLGIFGLMLIALLYAWKKWAIEIE
jgi:hypothetical protein